MRNFGLKAIENFEQEMKVLRYSPAVRNIATPCMVLSQTLDNIGSLNQLLTGRI